MKHKDTSTLMVAAAILISGLAFSWSYFVSHKKTFVLETKGLSEKAVKADTASWTMTYKSNGKTFKEAVAQSLADKRKVSAFFKAKKFSETEYQFSAPRLEENYNNAYNVRKFAVNTEVVIVTEDVEKMQTLSNDAFELMQQQIALSSWEKPQYIYTKLDAIKPLMIQEATKQARQAAQKFAEDSGNQVGQLMHARQGFFSYKGKSESVSERQQIEKIARVVIHVKYALKN